jgi:DNA-binding transcriptional LysR family regulator
MQDLINRLQWRHLRLIHSINEYGQISIAADRLSITQPAASRMLAEVEAMVGQRLFIRNPKGMEATAIAKVLIRHAASLLRGLAATATEVNAFSLGKTGTVRVGSVTGAAVAYVVPAIQALKQDAKGADVHIDVASSAALMEGLLNGDYDFILSRIPPDLDARRFEVMQGRVETVEFLVRPGHPLILTERPNLTHLAGYSWVIQASGTPMRQAVEESFIAHKIALPDEIVNTTSLLVMIAYLQTSDSISPISSEVAELIRRSGAGGMKTITVRQSIIISPYHLIQRKAGITSPLAHRLRDLVIDSLSAGLA